MKKYLFVCLVACIGTANASFISVDNAGFEAQVLGDGAFNSNVSDWDLSGTGGTFNPTNSQFPSGASEGENTAWTQGGIISQNLADNLESSFIYTLTVDVGNSATIAFGGYNIQLLAGGNVIAEDNNSLTPLSGEFVTSSLSYTSLIGDVLLGQGLEVRLSRFGSVGETNFDNVTLEQTTVSAVPAPAAVWLLGSGLIGLIGMKKKPLNYLKNTSNKANPADRWQPDLFQRLFFILKFSALLEFIGHLPTAADFIVIPF